MQTQHKPSNLTGQTLDHGAAILHEQLALQRIKELQEEEQHNLQAPAPQPNGWVRLWRTSTALVRVVLKPSALTRAIGPDHPPADLHETDQARFLRATQML